MHPSATAHLKLPDWNDKKVYHGVYNFPGVEEQSTPWLENHADWPGGLGEFFPAWDPRFMDFCWRKNFGLELELFGFSESYCTMKITFGSKVQPQALVW